MILHIYLLLPLKRLSPKVSTHSIQTKSTVLKFCSTFLPFQTTAVISFRMNGVFLCAPFLAEYRSRSRHFAAVTLISYTCTG